MTSRDNGVDTDVHYTPHRCPICARTPRSYSGKLVSSEEEAPICENHKPALRAGRLTPEQVTMVPVPQ